MHLNPLSRTSARGLVLAVATASAVLIASCSKPISQNRYDGAMELAKSYSIQYPPERLLAELGRSPRKSGHSFADLAWNHAFIEKFEAATEELDMQEYSQPDNRSLLEALIAASKLPCDIEESSPAENVRCELRDVRMDFRAEGIRLLHTDEGNFLFSSADVSRGNSVETNTDNSPMVIVVDSADGGFGAILEDRIAIVGGRHDLVAAALTLASSIVRVESEKNTKPSLEDLRYDLMAAKSKRLFSKPTHVGDDAVVNRLTLAQAQQGFDEVNRRLDGQATGTPSPNGQPPLQETSGPFTKDQFKRLVLGKTMAEVRSAIGDPSTVDSHADGVMWFYWSSKLPVQDPDSGVTFTSSSILFDPDTKVAIKVGF